VSASDPKLASLLVVEDDTALLRMLTQALRVAGHDVEPVTSVAEANAATARGQFELALIDIRLPDGDGVELGEALLQTHGLQCLHLTGQAEREDYERAAQSGALGYLIKPVSVEQLIAAVEMALSRSVELSRLNRSVDQLSTAFEERKSISIAVGIIMERFGLAETEAFEVLRHFARSRQQRLETAADRLVAREGGLELLASLQRYLSRVDGTGQRR